MRDKKIIFLLLALLLPVSIFFFLKIFGKNEFVVMPLHQEKIEGLPGHCVADYKVPYVLPDSVMRRINSKTSLLYLVNFSKSENVSLNEAIRENEVVIIPYGDILYIREDSLFFRECILLLKAPDDLVLIDNKGRIRGYYQGGDREEIDRLQVELSIILKKY